MKSFYLIILIAIFYINCEPSFEDIQEAIKNKKLKVDDLKKMKNKNVPPSVVVFYFEKEHIHEREMYASYLKEFLSTFGMTVTNFFFGNKDELIATLQVGDDFDKTYVTKTFKGIIRDVLIRDFTKDL